MSSNQSSSSKRTSKRSKSSKKATQSYIDDRFNHRYYTISVHLHVKSTKFKGNVNANVIPQSRPFTQSLLHNISIEKDWDDVEELIYDATQTPEFRVKYGKVNYDIERGVTGWKGKRGK